MAYNAQSNTITDSSGFTYTPTEAGLKNYQTSSPPTPATQPNPYKASDYPGNPASAFSPEQTNALKAPTVNQNPDLLVSTAQPNPATVNATPYTQGFAAAQASGTPAPQNAGEAATAVKGFTEAAAQAPTFYKPPGDPNPQQVYDAKGKPLSYEDYKAAGGKGVMGGGGWEDVKNGPIPTPDATPIQGIDAQLAADPGYQQLLQDYAKYNSIEEKNKSLVDTYNEAIKSSGLEAINTELINTKNIIDGTEDDIRNEVRTANGFATDSQVMALAQARNKTLIKSYNKLVDQQQAITNQVNTMVNLAGQDRQFALQSINQKLQIDQQIAEYRDKFISNAREGYNNIIKAVGYGGLYAALSHDPSAVALAERTLGIAPGQLSQLASYKKPLTQAEQMDLELKQSQITENNAQTAKIYNDMGSTPDRQTQIVDLGNGHKQLIDSNTGEMIKDYKPGDAIDTPMQQAQAKAQIESVDGLLKDKALNSAVGPNYFSRFSIKNQLSGAKSNFIAGVEQMRSQLNIDALIKAKGSGATFGALSDQELQVLASTATKIGTWAIKDKNGNVTGYNASEKDFRKELDKINNFAKLDYILKGGKPEDVGIQQMPDGSFWVDNSDGTKTKILDHSPTSFNSVGNTKASVPSNQVAGVGPLAMKNPNPKNVIAGIDLTSYATDPKHEANVKKIYQSIPPMTTSSSQGIDQYIQGKFRGSPVKGQDVLDAAKQYGIDANLILAIMQQDSSMGTAGKAVRTKNPGNVGNTDSGATKGFKTWRDGVFAVAKNLSKRRTGPVVPKNYG